MSKEGAAARRLPEELSQEADSIMVQQFKDALRLEKLEPSEKLYGSYLNADKYQYGMQKIAEMEERLITDDAIRGRDFKTINSLIRDAKRALQAKFGVKEDPMGFNLHDRAKTQS